MPTPRWPISRDTPLTATTAMNHLQTSKHVPPSPAAGRVRGRLTMIRSNLRVVYDPYILVSLRGTCFRAKYRRQDAPWLATDEYVPEDPEATITSNEFRALAWAAANYPAGPAFRCCRIDSRDARNRDSKVSQRCQCEHSAPGSEPARPIIVTGLGSFASLGASG